MPEGTIAAFQDHGTVARTVDADVEGARAEIAALAGAGVSLDDGHPQARGRRREVVLGLVRFADRDDPAESRRAARRLMATTAKRPAPNPLRAGLRVGGASEPTVFVIYGGVGRPLPAQAPAGDLQPRRPRPPAEQVRRDRLLAARDGQRDLPRVRPHGGREVLADAGRRPPLAGVRTEPALPGRGLRRGGVQGPRPAPRGDRCRPWDGREPRLLPLDAGELLPGDRAGDGRDQAEQAAGVRPRRHREAVRPRSGLGAGARRRRPPAVLARARSTASTTTWARRPSRTSSRSGSPTRSSSPSGTTRYVDHVQITVGESIGVEHRAAFYEETGVVRDIVQNHLLQVFALVAMEPPASFDADPIRDEKAKLLRATRPMTLENSVRGQYGEGYVAGEQAVALPRGAERPARLEHADLHRGEARDRQLALGGDAVLHPGGEAACQAGDRGRGPVQAPAAPAVPDRRGRAARGQRARPADPARRGDLAPLRRQGARRRRSRCGR